MPNVSRRGLVALVAVLAAGVPACFSPGLGDTSFTCSDGICPAGFFCGSDGCCHREGSADRTFACFASGPPDLGPDGPGPDRRDLGPNDVPADADGPGPDRDAPFDVPDRTDTVPIDVRDGGDAGDLVDAPDVADLPDLVDAPDLIDLVDVPADPPVDVAPDQPSDGAADADLGADAGDAGGSPQAGRVIITELGVFGPQLIEVHNTTASPIDLRGFTFHNAAAASADLRAASDPDGTGSTAVMLAPGGHAFGVPNPAAGSAPAGAAFVYGGRGTTFALATGGDDLTLVAADNTTLEDRVDFRSFVSSPTVKLGPAQFAGFAGLTTQLDPASRSATANDLASAWCTTFYPAGGARRRVLNTAGQPNGSCRNVAVINEVLIDATSGDDGSTFLEIAGPGGADVSGLAIEDIEGGGGTAGTRNSLGPVVLPVGTRIPVDGILLVADALTGGSTTSVANVTAADVVVTDMDLENGGGDGIQLVASDGTLLDAVGHDPAGAALTVTVDAIRNLAIFEGATALTPATAASLVRDAVSSDTQNNRNDLAEETSPTPGAPNRLVITVLEPDNGLAQLATPVTVRGRGFIEGTRLQVGGAASVSCTVLSSTAMSCTVPANGGTVARLDVTVLPPAGLGTAGTLASGFTYTGVQNETGAGGEADLCTLVFPTSIVASLASDVRSPMIYGRILEVGVTEAAGGSAQVVGQVGYGPENTNPTSQGGWLFFGSTFNGACTDCGTSDEYQGSFDLPATGRYTFTYRFSLDGGLRYTYCDTDGAGAMTGADFQSTLLGALQVDP